MLLALPALLLLVLVLADVQLIWIGTGLVVRFSLVANFGWLLAWWFSAAYVGMWLRHVGMWLRHARRWLHASMALWSEACAGCCVCSCQCRRVVVVGHSKRGALSLSAVALWLVGVSRSSSSGVGCVCCPVSARRWRVHACRCCVAVQQLCAAQQQCFRSVCHYCRLVGGTL